MAYDVIGDIHGHDAKLTALLRKLGYRNRLGAWRHPERTAIFVGDFIDRGPGQLETIRVIRAMLDAGSAQAVMGNHEFNAIAWSMSDPEAEGEYLRRHNSKNRRQHAAFLEETAHDPDLRAELVRWFLTLPLWLDLPGIRVIHACWHPGHMAEIEPHLKPGRRLDPALVVAASRRGSQEYRAIEALIKGLEITLPPGQEFQDKEGELRDNIRVRWWDGAADTYRKAGILGSAMKEVALPDSPIPEAARLGYSDEIPVFFGHYWWTGTPAPLAPRAACVDYSAAGGGPLVAYRWDGESTLLATNFVATDLG